MTNTFMTLDAANKKKKSPYQWALSSARNCPGFFYLLLLFAALYIADLYRNAVRLWILASAHAALSGLSSM